MESTLLSIRELAKSYSKDKLVLKNINLEIKEGEFIVIIGSSGAGKSTLIRCINRLVEPSKGEIIFEGLNVTYLKGKKLRKVRSKMGMIFQHYNLIGRTNVIKNVIHGRLGQTSVLKSMLGLYSEEEKQNAYNLLKQVGLEGQIYQKAKALSGGQMQRVGICRAMMQAPRILLADEPIASLDPNSAKIVMDYIHQITKENSLTCIMNLHQVDYALKYATRIIGLKEGSIVYDGIPENLSQEMIAFIYKGKVAEIKDGN